MKVNHETHVCCLSSVDMGRAGVVLEVSGPADVRRRLLEMGFCCGTSVKAIRRAPLGDPIEFRLRGYLVSLRREEAERIQVSLEFAGT